MTTVPSISARVHPRDGLGDVARRLRAAPGTIAYLGASVTAQREGYRQRLHELICREWGQSHKSVNAGTGALGSVSGVFLMDELVLAHRPDLCFVEYATADLEGLSRLADVGPAVEGIVQKLVDCGCAVCFLYLYRTDVDFRQTNEVIETYERVADHHGIPSVDVANAAQELIARGTITAAELLKDVLHTTPTGSRLVADAILDAMNASGSVSRRPSGPRPPMYERSFHGAQVVPATARNVRHPPSAERCRFRLVYEYVQLRADGCLECSFEGELVGIVVIVGPSSGEIRIRTERHGEEIMLWDRYCYYDRLSTAVFSSPCLPGEVVRIALTGTKVDHSQSLRQVPRAETEPKKLRVTGFMVRS